MKTPQGPNVRKLLVHYIAIEAIPDGSCKDGPGGGIAAGIGFLVGLGKKSPESTAAMARARANCSAALEAAKAARDNPFGDDEEAIAAEILKRVEERNARIRRASKIAMTKKPIG